MGASERFVVLVPAVVTVLVVVLIDDTYGVRSVIAPLFHQVTGGIGYYLAAAVRSGKG